MRKNPEADLKLRYKKVLEIGVIGSLFLLILVITILIFVIWLEIWVYFVVLSAHSLVLPLYFVIVYFFVF